MKWLSVPLEGCVHLLCSGCADNAAHTMILTVLVAISSPVRPVCVRCVGWTGTKVWTTHTVCGLYTFKGEDRDGYDHSALV